MLFTRLNCHIHYIILMYTNSCFCLYNGQQMGRYLTIALLHHASWSCGAALRLPGENCRDDSLAGPHFLDMTLSPAFPERNGSVPRTRLVQRAVNRYAHTAPANREEAGSSKKIIRSLELPALQAVVTMKR